MSPCTYTKVMGRASRSNVLEVAFKCNKLMVALGFSCCSLVHIVLHGHVAQVMHSNSIEKLRLLALQIWIDGLDHNHNGCQVRFYQVLIWCVCLDLGMPLL